MNLIKQSLVSALILCLLPTGTYYCLSQIQEVMTVGTTFPHGPTDILTDIPSYRDAWTQLLKDTAEFSYRCLFILQWGMGGVGGTHSRNTSYPSTQDLGLGPS